MMTNVPFRVPVIRNLAFYRFREHMTILIRQWVALGITDTVSENGPEMIQITFLS